MTTRHVYHIYAFGRRSGRRWQEALQAQGIQTGIHYPDPGAPAAGVRRPGLQRGRVPARRARRRRSAVAADVPGADRRSRCETVCDAVRRWRAPLAAALTTVSMRRAGVRPLLIFPCNGNGLEALDCLGEHIAASASSTTRRTSRARTRTAIRVLRSRRAGERAATRRCSRCPAARRRIGSRRELIEGLGVDAERASPASSTRARRVSPLAVVGRNVLIMAGVVITSNAVIGDHVVHPAEHGDPSRRR